MTIQSPATTDETTEILRFLHRFADLMSSGNNSDNLLRAASMLESHVGLLKETQDLLRVERVRGDAVAEMQKELVERIGEHESETAALKSELSGEIAALKSRLSEQELHATMVVAEMKATQGKLVQRAEEAEARLAELQNKPPEIPLGSIAVPLLTLRLAKGQFEALARIFEKSGDIISQVMCQASVSSLERVLLDSGAEQDDAPRRELSASSDRISAVG